MSKLLTPKLMFLSGIFMQLAILLFFYQIMSPEIWRVDLNVVIARYSRMAAADLFSNAEIKRDFKQRLANVIAKLPRKVILVDGAHLLSNQKSRDCTELILTRMQLHDQN